MRVLGLIKPVYSSCKPDQREANLSHLERSLYLIIFLFQLILIGTVRGKPKTMFPVGGDII